MPNVKEGSIIEYKMEFITPYYDNFDIWNFQYDIPVNYTEYKTNIPEYFIYNVRSKGYFFPKSTSEKMNKKFNFNTSTKVNERSNVHTFSHESVDYVETQTTYTATNVPAMKAEKYVGNINNYRSAVLHELSMERYPGGNSRTYNNTWEDVTTTIYKNEYFGLELAKNGYYEEDLKLVLQNASTNDQKIAAIFNHVKSTMKWNEYYGIYTSDGVKKAYKQKTGNVAEINLMLTSMLRHAGVEASPVLVSTIDYGIPMFPSKTAFNYVICAVEVSEALILLDATNAFTIPNITPFKTLNWMGRLIRKDGSSTEVPLNPKFLSRENHNMNYELTPENKIKGMTRTSYSHYNAYGFRNENSSISQENYIEKLEKEHNDIVIENYEVTGKKELSENIMETYSGCTTKFTLI